MIGLGTGTETRNGFETGTSELNLNTDQHGNRTEKCYIFIYL